MKSDTVHHRIILLLLDFFSFDDPGIGLRFVSNPMVSAAGFQARSSEYSEKTYNGHFMFRTFWYTVLLCIYSFVTFLILACKTWFFGCYTSISILTGWYLSVGVCVQFFLGIGDYRFLPAPFGCAGVIYMDLFC